MQDRIVRVEAIRDAQIMTLEHMSPYTVRLAPRLSPRSPLILSIWCSEKVRSVRYAARNIQEVCRNRNITFQSIQTQECQGQGHLEDSMKIRSDYIWVQYHPGRAAGLCSKSNGTGCRSIWWV